MDEPRYIYKLVSESLPATADLPEVLPVSKLDQNSGFMHMSTAGQVPDTLQRFFGDSASVNILRVDFVKLKNDLEKKRQTVDEFELKSKKYEVIWRNPDKVFEDSRPSEGAFPHLYNGFKLGKEEIESVQVWTKGDSWEDAVSRAQDDGWLV